jgi:hypothetical protein
MLAMELIPVIRARLAELDARGGNDLASGQRAAFWRAQQHAARADHTLEDLRRYCLDSLKPRLLDERNENDFLRGFREGFQVVLTEIRRIETRGPIRPDV